ncbi:MAG: ABC transporter permease [Planctomycetota bacterium]
MSKLLRNIRLGIKTLLLHKLRSALTMLGVVFGVGSVIAMLSVGEGASREAREQIRKLGSNNILIESQEPVEEASNSGGQRTRLNKFGILYDDVDRIRSTIPSVARVVPAKTIREEGRLGRNVEELRLVGTTADWFELVPRPVQAGRVMSRQDELNFNDVVVLTESGARKLLAGESTVGNRVSIGGGSYEVIGIVQSAGDGTATGGTGLPTPDQDVDAYVPLAVAKERFGDIFVEISAGNFSREEVQLHQMIVEVDQMENVPQTADAVQRVMDLHHPKGDYKMTVPLELLRQAERTKRTFNIVLGSIAGISLLVGGIGIMNIMLASVTERTREIGIRRAIGARRSQIIQQFLIETLVLTTVGGLVGIGVGLVIPAAITWYAGMPTQIMPWMLALSVGISVVTGIIFGLYPAVRAANLDPIQALRHE